MSAERTAWITCAMQRRRFLRLASLGAGLLGAGLLGACARSAETPPAAPTTAPAPGQTPAPAASPTPVTAATGGTFVIARLTDTITLDPSRQYELTSPIVMGACYERLVTIQPPDIRTIHPHLAEKFDITQDVTTYTFTLREGVRFASGNQLTSADVVFSFNRLRELKDNPSWLADIIQAMETPDARTVRIRLTEPNAAFLAMLVSPNFSILDSTVVKQQGGTDQPGADKTDKATEWLNQNSAGSGPFVLKGWVKEQEIVMERNPNYWGQPAALERVIIRHIPDPTTQRQLLERVTSTRRTTSMPISSPNSSRLARHRLSAAIRSTPSTSRCTPVPRLGKSLPTSACGRLSPTQSTMTGSSSRFSEALPSVRPQSFRAACWASPRPRTRGTRPMWSALGNSWDRRV